MQVTGDRQIIYSDPMISTPKWVFEQSVRSDLNAAAVPESPPMILLGLA
jgi:hypothetical protein